MLSSALINWKRCKRSGIVISIMRMTTIYIYQDGWKKKYEQSWEFFSYSFNVLWYLADKNSSNSTFSIFKMEFNRKNDSQLKAKLFTKKRKKRRRENGWYQCAINYFNKMDFFMTKPIKINSTEIALNGI